MLFSFWSQSLDGDVDIRQDPDQLPLGHSFLASFHYRQAQSSRTGVDGRLAWNKLFLGGGGSALVSGQAEQVEEGVEE